ncbi:hypothetical protein XO10_08175 [Marinitoga sp. 1135]|uniref:radical SAM/SPASM domain-containing protein n=1 Tax=unclassified Marinitoga TaxID=2640159 RepID=UPI0015864403|nr:MULTISPECIES: radical SAM protein [unclassified Marinitoga]NUU96231.1 hypothetical protein [Marinitoga sp. 1135]NUU98154.1 hypothetical protein [Marinitoga sp. 1138]
MSMRIGRYLTFFVIQNKIYAYNALNNGLCELKNESYEILIKKDFKSLEKLYPEVFYELKKALYIVSEDFDEKNYVKLKNWEAKFLQNNLSLTIAPTLDCNFKCFYCYQQEYKQESYMNKSTADKVFDFIDKRITPNIRFLHINWYGGEPLLNIEIIEYLSKKIKKLLDNKKIEFKSSIITNGYLLNEEYAKILSKNCNVETIQITLDGPKEIHDIRRPHKNGESYDIIINNLKNISQYFKRILVRINMDKTNEEKVPDLLEELKKLNLNIHPYIAPVSLDNIHHNNFAKTCFHIEEFALKYLKIKEKDEYSYLSNYPVLTFGSCGAVRKNSFVIDPDGNIYKCWNEVGQKEKSIGTVSEGITNYSRYIKWMAFDPLDIKECSECSILPLCNGGCPYRILFPEDGDTLGKRCSEYKWTLKNELSLWIKNNVLNNRKFEVKVNTK